MLEQGFVKQFLTFPQAAEYLGLSKSCLYKKTYKREIPFYKPGNKIIYFLQNDLDAFALSNRHQSAEELKKEVDDLIKKGRNHGK